MMCSRADVIWLAGTKAVKVATVLVDEPDCAPAWYQIHLAWVSAKGLPAPMLIVPQIDDSAAASSMAPTGPSREEMVRQLLHNPFQTSIERRTCSSSSRARVLISRT